MSNWISVKERLPENNGAYLITWINREPESYYAHIKDVPFVDEAVFFNGKWWWFSSVCEDMLNEYGKCYNDYMGEQIEVIAWMPLPKPYEWSEEEV